MNAASKELFGVLRETRAFLALPTNDFVHSGWPDSSTALAEMDRYISEIENDKLSSRFRLELLFAPTGAIQEVSVYSGWGNDFLTLAERFDCALVRCYGQRT